MKRKYFLVGLFLMLVMFLVGCNGNGGSTPPITLNQSPTASFTANPTSGVVPLEVAFNASSSSDTDGSITSYAWDFKDGDTGNGEAINHTFSSIGSYNVELIVTDNEGATDSTTKNVTVTETTNQSPAASFTANPTSGVAPLAVSFNASSSSDSDGSIISYEWDFKDGDTGNGETISHSFSSIGSYNVKLTVTDNEGATDSTTKTITVTDTSNQFNHPPEIISRPEYVATVGVEWIWDVDAIDLDGDILTYSMLIYPYDPEFTYPEGMIIDVVTGVITWTPTEDQIGTANLTVKVTDGQAGATFTCGILVRPVQSPTANFTATPTSGIAPLAVSFNASSSSDSDGTIISYTWNFGDGSNGSGVIINHIYENAGDYTVQLTVSDNDSASDSITMDIEVISGTIADGIISSNTSWTIANSPYIIINEDLQIAQNITLSIEEGVIVKANSGREIRVAGNLNTNGSESAPVKFTSLGSNKWWGIEFIDSPNSNISNTIIEKASRAIDLKGNSLVSFTGNIFKYNGWVVTDTYGYQNMHFLNNTFFNNEEVFYGIRTSGDENRFENNIFIDNNNVFSFGYYIGQTVITNNNFLNNNFIIKAPEIGYGCGTVDMLNNFWGTTDTSVIDSYIEDGNDDVTLQTLNYNPIKNSKISSIGSPISVE